MALSFYDSPGLSMFNPTEHYFPFTLGQCLCLKMNKKSQLGVPIVLSAS